MEGGFPTYGEIPSQIPLPVLKFVVLFRISTMESSQMDQWKDTKEINQNYVVLCQKNSKELYERRAYTVVKSGLVE